MRGTWDDVNRRLTGAILALDLDDALVIGDRQPPLRRSLGDRLLGRKPARPPRRFVQVTAAQRVLLGECVGSTSFGGEWEMSEETERTLEKMGWQRPWSDSLHTYQRESSLQRAPRLALAAVRALQVLGCEVADLDVEVIRVEQDGGTGSGRGWY